jgi:hypothetical protein
MMLSVFLHLGIAGGFFTMEEAMVLLKGSRRLRTVGSDGKR